jgi:aspartate racemase
MGPAATVDLMHRIVEGTPAEDDADHIRMLVDNNPAVPSRIAYLIHGRGDSPVPTLIEMAKGLVAQGADFLIMPCNTAHLFIDDIRAAVEVPFVSMIDAALASVTQLAPNHQRVGLLASTAVVQTGLYESVFKPAGIAVVAPGSEQQSRVMSIIQSVKAARQTEADKIALHEVAVSLSREVDCLLIACTELSAFCQGLGVTVPVIDASQSLAEETINIALGRKNNE